MPILLHEDGLFDELWLAIYSVTGLTFYIATSLEHLQLSSGGAATKQSGYTKVFCGPRCELDPFQALKMIEAKMVSKGCSLVAIVEWEKGRSTLHASSTESKCRVGSGCCV